jgi:septum site-determining protein MinD
LVPQNQYRFLSNVGSKIPTERSNWKRPGRVVVITSGKGGVGKTTASASIAYGLALKGHRTCVVDFDIGLRNLDLHLGAERRVIFDFVNVIQQECNLNQALIKDRHNPNLYLLAASQTKDKDVLTFEGVERVLTDLTNQFEYVVLDSPAGIESGARHSMYFADDAIITTNPEISACIDSDKMIGFISSRSKRAETGKEPVNQMLLVNRYDAERAENEEMLQLKDITELLGLSLLGVIPESKSVLTATNLGQPVISLKDDDAAMAYEDAVARYLGEEREMRFIAPPKKGFFANIFS